MKRKQRNNYLGEIPGMLYDQNLGSYTPIPLGTQQAQPAQAVTLPSSSLDQMFANEGGMAPTMPEPDTSGSSGVAPAPRPELASSPEWLAFLNQLGLEEGQFRADIERQRGVAGALAAQQGADIQAQGPLERRNIAGGLESRGMARSGQFIRSLAEQRANEGRKQGQVQSGLAGTLSGLESSLSQKLIDIGSRRAQQELSLRAGGYV